MRHESYGKGVVDLNARCLQQQLRVFAAESSFAKLKRFIQIECTRTGEARKMRGSRSRRGLFLLEVFFFAPLWTQPFVSFVACESSLSIDEFPEKELEQEKMREAGSYNFSRKPVHHLQDKCI